MVSQTKTIGEFPGQEELIYTVFSGEKVSSCAGGFPSHLHKGHQYTFVVVDLRSAIQSTCLWIRGGLY